MSANNRVHYGPMVVFVCLRITPLHSHRYTDVSEGIGFFYICQSNLGMGPGKPEWIIQLRALFNEAIMKM